MITYLNHATLNKSHLVPMAPSSTCPFPKPLQPQLLILIKVILAMGSLGVLAFSISWPFLFSSYLFPLPVQLRWTLQTLWLYFPSFL